MSGRAEVVTSPGEEREEEREGGDNKQYAD